MLFTLLKTVLTIGSLLFAATTPRLDDDIERDWHPSYLKLATGDIHARHNGPTHDWPVRMLSIGHSIASYQYYEGWGGADPGKLSTGAYFHHGLDIRADARSDVRAAAGGKVVNIENYEPGKSAYWEIAILDDEGFIWQYHHVEHTSIPQEIFTAFSTGQPIAAGTKLGEVFYWSVVTFGERYHHCHLNVVGKNKEYLNPFAFLMPLDDESAPVIKEIALYQNGRKLKGNRVSGDYNLIAHVTDLILHEQFVVPPNTLTVAIDDGAPETVWKFDTLPGGDSDTKYVHDFFVKGEVCGDYQCRRPVMNLGFIKDGRRRFPNTPGEHHVKVTASDFQENTTSKEFRWTVID